MKLNSNNYHSLEANRRYMSVSQFKGFLPSYGGCEARSMAILNGEYERPYNQAFVEGHYVHAWNEGKLDEFKESNPHLYSTRGASKGRLKSEFKHCDTIIEALESDELIMKVLDGKKEVIMTAELFGVEWKIMIDSYQPDLGTTGVFADLKVMRSLDGKYWNNDAQMYENFIQHYGYDLQMGIYAEVERLNTNKEHWAIPHMVVATKENPPNKEILYFDYDSIQSSLNIVENNIERVKAVKSGEEEPIRCEKCEYCRLTKKAKIRHYAEFELY